MITHTTRRDRNREGYLADPLTMYSIDHIFGETFSMSMFHKLVFGEYNLDLDYIYDRCEESGTSFEGALRKISKILYENSSPFQKNKLAYKYFHNLGLEIKSLVDKVSNILREVQDVDLLESLQSGENNTTLITNRIKALDKATLDRYAEKNLTAEYMDTPDFKLLRIIDDFLFNHLEVYNKVRGDLTESFNNVVKNEYRKRLAKSTLAMNAFLGYEELHRQQSAVHIVSTPTRSTSLYTNLNNTITNSTNTVYNLFNDTTSTSNTLINDDGWENMLGTYRSQVKLKPKPEKISKKTPGVKILNKSLKIIRKFFPATELMDFLKCIEVVVPGELFDYGFKLRERKDLIRYSKNITTFSINWDLVIYTKLGEKIARSCITFKGSPILDQVLAVYLLLKSGKEKEILLNSGFFDREYPYFSEILEPLVKSLKDEKLQNTNIDNLRETNLRREEINETLDGLYGSDRYQNLRRNRYLEHIFQQTEIKTSINNWIREYFFVNGFDRTLYDYTTNLDVSFGEAVDYEAFSLFNITCFDYLVKPLTWKKDLFRFQNRILLDIDKKAEVINMFTPVSKRQVQLVY